MVLKYMLLFVCLCNNNKIIQLEYMYCSICLYIAKYFEQPLNKVIGSN